MPIYIRTLGYKIYIWSNDFENARRGSAFYAPILRFFGKNRFVVCKEENLLRFRCSIIHGKKY